jgi:hypothetical protein
VRGRIAVLVASVGVLVISCAAEQDTTKRPVTPPPKFQADVVPILSTYCALAACHSSKESPQSFYMTTDPKQMYDELMKTSPTCATWSFVVPGNPDKSMVMVKMDGEESSLPNECASARRSEMPPGDPPGSDSQLLVLKLRDVVRAWIKAGAKND